VHQKYFTQQNSLLPALTLMQHRLQATATLQADQSHEIQSAVRALWSPQLIYTGFPMLSPSTSQCIAGLVALAVAGSILSTKAMDYFSLAFQTIMISHACRR